MSDDDAARPSIKCADCGATINPATDPSFCRICGSENRSIETRDEAVLNVTEAATVDRRIEQTFAFLRDVLANPSLVEKIPSGATLRHRDVVLGQTPVVVHLTAYRTPAMPAWAATITGAKGSPVRRSNGQRLRLEAVGDSGDAALDALEAQVRHAAEVGALPR
jgi:hypothetical protein